MKKSGIASNATKRRKVSRILSILQAVLLCLTAFAAVSLLLLGRVNNSLYCSETNADCGMVKSGRPLIHQFVITNISIHNITVYNSITGCGCTTAAISHRLPYLLQPLHSVSVNVSVDTTGMIGKISKDVAIKLSKDDMKYMLLTVTGNVQSNTR